MAKLIKRTLAAAAVVLAALAVIIAFNTIRYVPEKIESVEPAKLEVDIAKASNVLSRAVQFRTISTDTSHPDFDRFLTFLETTYPAVHATTERDLIAGQTPLYKWAGSGVGQKPILFAAHYDVVPALEDSLDQWEHPPFSGQIADGFVWGRGTLDNKGALIALMEAAEKLINQGFEPTRTVYFSFGHDEEVGGRGARAVARYLKQQNVQLEWALDEGSFVLERRFIKGLDKPVASINLAEKGYLTLELVAKGQGGHSSLPPQVTAVGRLAKAISKLQDAPVPGGLSGLSEQFFDALGRHFDIGRRIIFANRWLFDPILERMLSADPSTNAMLRTTTAPTMLSASTKENVLATQAVGTVNFRLHPRDTIEGIVDYVRQTIDDEQIEVRISGAIQAAASPVSSADVDGFNQIKTTIQSVFGELAIVPGLTIAATDARHYALAADHTYRINPFKVTRDDIKRFHGISERLSQENLEKGIRFYALILSRQ
ncbi:MAG: M20 family peptidase [Rhizobiaceae bacterium]